MDDVECVPSNSVGGKHVSEEPSDVAEPVCFIAMDGFVVCCEGLLKEIRPETVQFGETFADEAVELGVGSFLRTAFDHHGAKFMLEADRKSNLHKLLAIYGV